MDCGATRLFGCRQSIHYEEGLMHTPLEKQLLSALQGVHLFFNLPGENSNDAFERVAAVFCKETGYLRPGKDCVIHSHEERRDAWDKWVAGKLAAAQNAIDAATGEA
jgi:hypothetical protein